MSTLLCVPIMVEDLAPAMADAEQARALGADMVEFRVDQVFHGAGDTDGAALVARLAHDSPLPCIVTCRPTSEGGEYDGDDADRIALYERLGTDPAHHPPRYIDVELSTYSRSANLRQKVNLAVGHSGQMREVATGLILSAHDFSGRPANLFSLLGKMREESAARVLKLAWRARSLRDNLEVFDILRERDRPTIALAMGEYGLMSRVLAPKFGGFLTFASLRDTSATAPGQPTLRELLDLYRFRSIAADTRVFGVIGWPVGHSMSPAVHNAGFEWLEGRSGVRRVAVEQSSDAPFRGVYLPLPIPAEWEHFKASLASLLDYGPLDFRGASVTLPHKEHLLRFAAEDTRRRWTIDPLARRVGSANTLVIADDGAARVLNTDVDAVVSALARGLGRPLSDLSGLRVVVLGAGGAARAAAVGVLDVGASVTFCNRGRERAEKLAAELGASGRRAQIMDLDQVKSSRPDVIINCTPVGMTGGPAPGETPVDLGSFAAGSEGPLVFDTVYNPLETPLLASAKRQGLRTIDGVEMFVAQAAAQFEAWTGLAPGLAPRALFGRVVRETLGGEQA
jgi:3-dehydroquinate dehydratase/shikimate dehydrogenase